MNKRDIVQFVPYRLYQNSLKKFVAETLQEVPSQVVNYFFGNNTMPYEKEALQNKSNEEDKENTEKNVN